jgi:hypothetical protein
MYSCSPAFPRPGPWKTLLSLPGHPKENLLHLVSFGKLLVVHPYRQIAEEKPDFPAGPYFLPSALQMLCSLSE